MSGQTKRTVRVSLEQLYDESGSVVEVDRKYWRGGDGGGEFFTNFTYSEHYIRKRHVDFIVCS